MPLLLFIVSCMKIRCYWRVLASTPCKLVAFIAIAVRSNMLWL